MRTNTCLISMRKGENYIINGCSLGHFYKKKNSHKYRLLFRTLLYNKFFSQIQTTLYDTFIKKIYSQIQTALWHTFIKKKFFVIIKKFLRNYKKSLSLTNFFFFRFVLAQYKIVEVTREEYNLIGERRGIKKPQNMSTKKLINTFNRYDSKRKGEKLSEIGLKKLLT